MKHTTNHKNTSEFIKNKVMSWQWQPLLLVAGRRLCCPCYSGCVCVWGPMSITTATRVQQDAPSPGESTRTIYVFKSKPNRWHLQRNQRSYFMSGVWRLSITQIMQGMQDITREASRSPDSCKWSEKWHLKPLDHATHANYLRNDIWSLSTTQAMWIL